MHDSTFEAVLVRVIKKGPDAIKLTYTRTLLTGYMTKHNCIVFKFNGHSIVVRGVL